MTQLAVLVSAILPEGAPRVALRYAIPLKEVADVETVFLRKRKGNKLQPDIRFFFTSIYSQLKRRPSLVIVFDPFSMAAVLLIRLMVNSPSNKIKYVYDRNEDWPKNWHARSRLVLRLISKYFPSLFLKLESHMAQNFDQLVAVNRIVLKRLNVEVQKSVYPNRSVLGSFIEGSSLDIREKKFEFVYLGSVNSYRAIDAVINALLFGERTKQTKLKPLLIVGRISKALEPLVSQAVKSGVVEHVPWSSGLSLYHLLCSANYGIVSLTNIGQYKHTLPSKVADYFELKMPVLALGKTRSLEVLALFFNKQVCHLENPDDFEFSRASLAMNSKSFPTNTQCLDDVPRKRNLVKILGVDESEIY